jgi:hypothetical protein
LQQKRTFMLGNLYYRVRPKHVLYQILVNVRLKLYSGHLITAINTQQPGSKNTMKQTRCDSGSDSPGVGNQGGQFGNEIHRLEDHVGGAVSVWRFQLIPDLALIRQ